MYIRAETKPWGHRNCLERTVFRHRSGAGCKKKSYCIRRFQEKSVLHNFICGQTEASPQWRHIEACFEFAEKAVRNKIIWSDKTETRHHSSPAQHLWRVFFRGKNWETGQGCGKAGPQCPPSNGTVTLTTQPRQHRSDWGAALWLGLNSLAGPLKMIRLLTGPTQSDRA